MFKNLCEVEEKEMKMVNSKSQLAVALSKLELFTKPNLKLEQYSTDSEVAGGALWNAALNGDIEGKKLMDLGCGTGVLGIGALLLGASKVWFIDIDNKVFEALKRNLEGLEIDPDRYEIIQEDVKKVEKPEEGIDIVFQNPPFGTKEDHADKKFLEKAFTICDIIYSFHKSSTKKFVEAISSDNGFEITHRWDFLFPLKNTQKFHKNKIKRIEVSCFRMEKEE